ncbi:MAG: DUF4388 domain-containing protein, partial [Mycobacteriales bacterium]
MLKGDLSSTTLASVLLDLASDSASGSLILSHPDGEEAQIFLRSGLVCGINAPDRRADLGAKLVSSGILAPEALADAQEAQRTDLSAWNLGELLVHLGYVEEEVVQQFVNEQLYEALWDLMRWTEGRWKFRKNAKTREDLPPVPVVELLETLRERGHEWETIAEIVDSPNAVPMLSARGDGAPETTLDSDAWSMLCKIDGVRTVAELAADCGYTLFEAGQVLVALVDAGLVDVNEDGDEGSEDVYGAASALADVLAAGRPDTTDPGQNGNGNGNGGEDALSRLARLASEVTSHAGSSSQPATNPLQLDVMAAQLSGSRNLTVPVSRKSGESFASAMGRVSGALVDAQGPAPEQIDNDPIFVRPKPKAVKRQEESVDLDEQRRRRRAAAAAELAEAQAAVESLRPDRKFDNPATEAPPRLVDLETERARVAAREAEEAARHAKEGAAREAAEKFAREAVEQAARIQQEQAERAAEDAERLAVEQAAAEETARRAADEAARIAAERTAAEEAARIAAEQLAAEQAARAAAEEAARVAAEEAAAAKAEAARVAEERAAAEEAARLAAEQAAAEEAAAKEAARIAAEQAAAEEAARLAAKQAAAEEAARVAADRAAEEEAARLAAEQAAAEEAAQVAAEQTALPEAARPAQDEAERKAETDPAARVEAERLAAAAEAERVAQEAEARAALAAAQAQAEAATEAARVAQEAAEQAMAQAAAEQAERLA